VISTKHADDDDECWMSDEDGTTRGWKKRMVMRRSGKVQEFKGGIRMEMNMQVAAVQLNQE
jgi:hypothetical protein